jgi:hypothetical protein
MLCMQAMYFRISSEFLQPIDVYLHALVGGFASTPAVICESVRAGVCFAVPLNSHTCSEDVCEVLRCAILKQNTVNISRVSYGSNGIPSFLIVG